MEQLKLDFGENISNERSIVYNIFDRGMRARLDFARTENQMKETQIEIIVRYAGGRSDVIFK